MTVPESEPYYKHVYEGSDDMPAHLKNSILGCSLNIPVTNGQLNMGVWQGVYLYEHRYAPMQRRVMLHVVGES